MTSFGDAAGPVAFPSTAIDPLSSVRAIEMITRFIGEEYRFPLYKSPSLVVLRRWRGSNNGRVCEGSCRVHVGVSAHFSHWYDAVRGWSGQWIRQFVSDCANARPRCTHHASVTSHLAVQNATSCALIPCLGNVSTGTGQCVCAHQINLQHRFGSQLLAISQMACKRASSIKRSMSQISSKWR